VLEHHNCTTILSIKRTVSKKTARDSSARSSITANSSRVRWVDKNTHAHPVIFLASPALAANISNSRKDIHFGTCLPFAPWLTLTSIDPGQKVPVARMAVYTKYGRTSISKRLELAQFPVEPVISERRVAGLRKGPGCIQMPIDTPPLSGPEETRKNTCPCGRPCRTFVS
jgi:hypothetical protein